MDYRRMAIEVESPEEIGYDRIRHNLAESSIADTPLRDLDVALDDLVLMYGDHRGAPGLRAAIAAPGAALSPDDVLVTPGAAGALFIVSTTLLAPATSVVVVRPNYATNLETPRASARPSGSSTCGSRTGGRSTRTGSARCSPRGRSSSRSRTRTTRPVRSSPTDVERELVEIVEAHPRARLLVDETYREMTFGGPPALAADQSASGSSASRPSRRPTACRGSGSAG